MSASQAASLQPGCSCALFIASPLSHLFAASLLKLIATLPPLPCPNTSDACFCIDARRHFRPTCNCTNTLFSQVSKCHVLRWTNSVHLFPTRMPLRSPRVVQTHDTSSYLCPFLASAPCCPRLACCQQCPLRACRHVLTGDGPVKGVAPGGFPAAGASSPKSSPPTACHVFFPSRIAGVAFFSFFRVTCQPLRWDRLRSTR